MTTLKLQEDSQKLNLAKYPVVQFKIENEIVNESYAYITDIKLGNKDIGVLPVRAGGEIETKIRDGKFSSARYRIVDTNNRVLSSGEYATKLKLKAELEEYRVYFFIIDAKVGDKSVHYATRIYQGEQIFTQHKNFAKKFSDKLIKKEALTEYLPFLTFKDKENKDLSRVNTKSSLANLRYAKMELKVEAVKPIRLKNINYFMSSFVMEKLVSATIDDKKHFFVIKEYFRIRDKDKSIYLLDYSRRMDEYYGADIDEDKINLGIESGQIRLNYDKSNLIFNKNNEIWKFESEKNRLSLIYSTSYDRIRHFSLDSDYKVIPVSVLENGDVDFVIVGRIPSGLYEGYYGIMYMRQSLISNSLEIVSFIEMDVSTTEINAKLGDFFRYDRNNALIFIIDDILYRISKGGKVEKLDADIAGKSYLSSNDGTMLAYNNGKNIKITYTQLEVDREIKATKPDTRLEPIGFWRNDDFTYAEYNEKTKSYNEVVVINSRNEIVKKYPTKDFEITKVAKKGDVVVVSRVDKKTKAPLLDESLLMSEQSKAIGTLVYGQDDSRGLSSTIKLSHMVDLSKVKVDKKVVISNEDQPPKPAKLSSSLTGYLGYLDGEFKLCDKDLSKVVKTVDIGAGVVRDVKGNIIWQRQLLKPNVIVKGMPFAQASSIADTPKASVLAVEQFYALESKYDDAKSLLENLEDNFRGRYIKVDALNMEQILFFGQINKPVIIKTKDGEGLVVLGMGLNSVIAMRPKANGIEYISFSQFEKISQNSEKYVVY